MPPVQEAIEARTRGGDRHMEMYQFPPRIDETPLPKHIKERISEDKGMFVKVKIPVAPGSADGEMEFRLKTAIDIPASGLVQQVLSKKLRSDSKGKALVEQYVLKVGRRSLRSCRSDTRQVIGRQEYLLGGFRLEQYQVVRRALAKGHERKDFSDILVRAVFQCQSAHPAQGARAARTQGAQRQQQPRLQRAEAPAGAGRPAAQAARPG